MQLVKKILLDKNRPGVQFLKYGACGGIAMVTDMVLFFLVAWLLFPALTEADVLVHIFHVPVEPVAESVRIINFRIGNVIAFMGSNLVAYILNVLFVFTAGKHRRWKEVSLFYAVSAVSVLIGVEVGAMLIREFGLSTSVSYVAKAVSTTLINYAARKFLIFHG